MCVSVPVTLLTLKNEVMVVVGTLAQRAMGQAGTGTTLGVVLLPIRAQAWGRRTTLNATHTPGGEHTCMFIGSSL